MKLYIYETDNVDPYENLATESYLTDVFVPRLQENCGEAVSLLFLWQNANTVVIGKNQNAEAEVNLSALEAGGGKLARRRSGGGAVFHDLGNLNFSFVAGRGVYDETFQLGVVLRAVNFLGLSEAVRMSGRNDLLIGGAKFSGNAFLRSGHCCCHHGTLLVSADFAKLSEVLNVDKKKLQSKGVASVRSRVANLSKFGSVTLDGLKNALFSAFSAEYGEKTKRLDHAAFDAAEIERLKNSFSSKDWLQNAYRKTGYTASERFPWGMLEIGFDAKDGIIENLQVFTDSMDENLSDVILKTFQSRAFTAAGLSIALGRPELQDAAALISTLL